MRFLLIKVTIDITLRCTVFEGGFQVHGRGGAGRRPPHRQASVGGGRRQPGVLTVLGIAAACSEVFPQDFFSRKIQYTHEY